MKLYVLEEWCAFANEWQVVAIVDQETVAQDWQNENWPDRRYGEYSLNEL